MAITFPTLRTKTSAAKITATRAKSNLLITSAIIESTIQTMAIVNPAKERASMSRGNGIFVEPEPDEVFGPSSAKKVFGDVAQDLLPVEFEPRTLEDDPAFKQLQESLDKRAASAEAESKRSFRISLASICFAAASFIVALISLLFR